MTRILRDNNELIEFQEHEQEYPVKNFFDYGNYDSMVEGIIDFYNTVKRDRSFYYKPNLVIGYSGDTDLFFNHDDMMFEVRQQRTHQIVKRFMLTDGMRKNKGSVKTAFSAFQLYDLHSYLAQAILRSNTINDVIVMQEFPEDDYKICLRLASSNNIMRRIRNGSRSYTFVRKMYGGTSELTRTKLDLASSITLNTKHLPMGSMSMNIVRIAVKYGASIGRLINLFYDSHAISTLADYHLFTVNVCKGESFVQTHLRIHNDNKFVTLENIETGKTSKYNKSTYTNAEIFKHIADNHLQDMRLGIEIGKRIDPYEYDWKDEIVISG